MSAPRSAPTSSQFLPALLWQLVKLRARNQVQGDAQSPCVVGQTTQGLTLLECLVAIVLIGLTVAMVAPPLLIATATRVQTRRAEQAIQVAQGEVDRISALVQQGNHQVDRLPAVVANLSGQAGPSSIAPIMLTARAGGCAGNPPPSTPVTANQAIRIDVDGDCRPDFFMQVFRTAGSFTQGELSGGRTATARRPVQFDLGVRVYSALAEANLNAGRLQTQPASLRLRAGQGNQATNPMAVIYRPVVWGEQADVLCDSVTPAVRAQISSCPPVAP